MQQQNRLNQPRTDIIEHLKDVLPFKIIITQSHERAREVIYWGVACVSAPADVYAMMTASLTDDQRQPRSRYTIDEANVQSI